MAPFRPLPRDAEGRQVIRIPRDEFIADRWVYEPGEHVSLIGITGSGKTTLMRQLLVATATPKLPAVVLAVKPRDANMRRLAREATLTVTTRHTAPSSVAPSSTHTSAVSAFSFSTRP